MRLPTVKIRVVTGIKTIAGSSSQSRRKGWRIKFRDVPSVQVRDGRLTREMLLLDKEQDLAEHRITSLEDGTVIYHSRERLTEHRGRGSAKGR